MILVNTDYITGKELEMLGLVKGSTIQSKNVGRDITQSLKTLVGGDTFMSAVDLDHAVGDLKVNGLAYKAVRNGILAGLVGHMKI